MTAKEGKLEKVAIQSYEDKKFNKKVGDPFLLPINPENYSRNFKVKQDDSQASGSSGNDNKFDKIAPEELKLDFYFDNTGTVEGNLLQGEKVSTQINNFLNIVYDLRGKTHQPRFLRICWGALVFDCKISDLSINFPLFNAAGEPLRAKLSATFKEYVEKYKRILLEDKQSPDLTHIRKVKENETLEFMLHEMYGTQDYLLQVAKFNQLTSFRLLESGQSLNFPPVEK